MNGKKWGLSLVLLLFLLVGGAGAYYVFRPDPMAAVMNLQQQMRNEDLTREQREELFGQMREAQNNLSEGQRQALRQQFEERMVVREQERMNAFFALARTEQIKQLDKEIDNELKRQKEREQRMLERQASGQGQGGQGQGGRGGQGGQGGQGGGGGGRGGGGGGGDRGQQARARLDSRPASAGAQSAIYRRMMNDRQAQRGLPITTGRGGFGGGGGRGGFGGGRGPG